jgi:hypothetical protein
VRRGLDPGSPPLDRDRLLLLLDSDDAGWDSLPVGDPGTRAIYIQSKSQINHVEKWNASDHHCLCGCGGKPLNPKKSKFMSGHHARLRLLEDRIELGLLDPNDLTPKLRALIQKQKDKRFFWKKGKDDPDESTQDARKHRPRPRVLDQWSQRKRKEADP